MPPTRAGSTESSVAPSPASIDGGIAGIGGAPHRRSHRRARQAHRRAWQGSCRRVPGPMFRSSTTRAHEQGHPAFARSSTSGPVSWMLPGDSPVGVPKGVFFEPFLLSTSIGGTNDHVPQVDPGDGPQRRADRPPGRVLHLLTAGLTQEPRRARCATGLLRSSRVTGSAERVRLPGVLGPARLRRGMTAPTGSAAVWRRGRVADVGLPWSGRSATSPARVAPPPTSAAPVAAGASTASCSPCRRWSAATAPAVPARRTRR